ncbi:hypothetical protein ACFXB4_00170 [Streptomyces lavendulae]|uniref:hypothetical protein n=1 Tax=Streptomyces lavendulae TaxID=1914 RepID=UPI0036BF9FAC
MQPSPLISKAPADGEDENRLLLRFAAARAYHRLHSPLAAGPAGSGRTRCAPGGGQRAGAAGSGQRAAGSGQRAAGSGQRAAGSGQRAAGSGTLATSPSSWTKAPA